MKRRERKKVELLAPAGNREAFYGAVHAGADAIYLGGEKFGARAYADNFSRDELTACIRYGHIHGCRSYLTVNTLMKEDELAELVDELKPLYEAGLDGVIVQDIGALRVIGRHFPFLELHASTQMTVTGPAGAKLLKELRVSRVVPARELDLGELGLLKKESGLEVEAFVHGAMCYCYSGACLFSSLLGGRSGNRGRCAQPCRLTYGTDSPGASVHRKEYYPLSLKDLCTIEHLPELIEGGIDSFKIEGRMKKPEYAAGVTAIYRKYLDRCLAHSEKHFHVEKQDMEALSRLYIRSQIQDGYYFRHNGREMVTLDSPSYSGSDEAYLERVHQQYIEQKKRLKIWMKAEFICSRPARIQMGTGKCQAEVWGSVVEPAQSRPIQEADIRKQLQKLGETSFVLESMEIHTDEKGFYPLKELNALRREVVRQLEDRVITSHGLIVERKMEPSAPKPDTVKSAALQPDITESVTLQPDITESVTPQPDAMKSVAPQPDVTESVAPQPDVTESVVPQLDVTKSTTPQPDTTESRGISDGTMTAEEGAGIRPPEEMWDTRRARADFGTFSIRGLRIHISTEEQLLHLAEHLTAMRDGSREHGSRRKIERLYVESSLLLDDRTGKSPHGRWEPEPNQGQDKRKVQQALRGIQEAGISLWIALPYILRAKDRKIMEQALELYHQGRIQGFLVRNLEEYGWLWQEKRQQQGRLPQWIQLDHTVYVWNSQAAAFWLKRGCGLTCPLELNAREWDRLLEKISHLGDRGHFQQAGEDHAPEKLVYGRIPMMVTANCIARTAGKCLHGQSHPAAGTLTDRYQTRFPVEIRCDVCMNVIYNSVPLSLHKEQAQNIYKRLSFTTESGRDMIRILEFFADDANGRTHNPPYQNYTTGHEKRGVL